MTQYLAEIKSIVDQIAAAGSSIDTEDIILHILNGLPSTYQAFKTSIRTRPGSLTLDDLYPLLLSEEVTLATEAAKEAAVMQTALYTSTNRGRGHWNYYCGKGRQTSFPPQSNNTSPPTKSRPLIHCQICLKPGHSVAEYWHRGNFNYSPSQASSARPALLAVAPLFAPSWVLDTGASSHMTNDLDNLSMSAASDGSNSVQVGSGHTLPIQHIGSGILPLPVNDQRTYAVTLSRTLESCRLHIPFLLA